MIENDWEVVARCMIVLVWNSYELLAVSTEQTPEAYMDPLFFNASTCSGNSQRTRTFRGKYFYE